jgi:hypothetical protein
MTEIVAWRVRSILIFGGLFGLALLVVRFLW